MSLPRRLDQWTTRVNTTVLELFPGDDPGSSTTSLCARATQEDFHRLSKYIYWIRLESVVLREEFLRE